MALNIGSMKKLKKTDPVYFNCFGGLAGISYFLGGQAQSRTVKSQ